MMCVRNIPAKSGYKVYRTAVRPTTVYGAECCAVSNKGERALHPNELRMWRWAGGKTRLDHVSNVDIWKKAHMYPIAEFRSGTG